MYKLHNYINKKVNSMKKYFKISVIISCLLASAHNSNASSFSKRMWGGSVGAVTVAACGMYYSSFTPGIIEQLKPVAALAPKDCGCNACPHTLANKPLSLEASRFACQELIKIDPNMPPNKVWFLHSSCLTPRQWYNIAHEISEKQIVPSCALSYHFRDFDQLIKRMIPESGYRALVETDIHCPLSPSELYALKIIVAD